MVRREGDRFAPSAIRCAAIGVTPDPKRPFGRTRRSATLIQWVAATALAVSLVHAAPKPNRLDRQIQAIVRQSPGRLGFWGVEAVQLPGGKLLCSLHAHHLFQPASNLKLFTLATALEKLGPDFTFLTTVEASRPPDAQGRVGNVYLVGRGDANFATSRVLPYAGPITPRNPAASLAAIKDLANQVTARGVREITGNLIADDRYFVDEPYPSDWAVGDLVWGYGAPVTALVFNDNELLLRVDPAPEAGEKARVWLEPVDGGYRIRNELETVGRDDPSNVQIDRAPGSTTLHVYGQIPAGAPEFDQTIAIQNPPRLLAELLRQDLEADGIQVEGRIQVRRLSPARAMEESAKSFALASRPARVVLAMHRSLPLADDIELTAKVSQNLHAESLLLTLGRELEGVGSRKSGLKVVAAFGREADIPSDEMRIVDGSGLSRGDLVAPDAIVQLLRFMSGAPHFRIFYDALPVAGVDGTLSDSFKGTPAVGRIHAKTGTLEHVDSLSGYMHLPSGQRVAFSIMGDADPLHHPEAQAVLDQIALAIFEQSSSSEDHPR